MNQSGARSTLLFFCDALQGISHMHRPCRLRPGFGSGHKRQSSRVYADACQDTNSQEACRAQDSCLRCSKWASTCSAATLRAGNAKWPVLWHAARTTPPTDIADDAHNWPIAKVHSGSIIAQARHVGDTQDTTCKACPWAERDVFACLFEAAAESRHYPLLHGQRAGVSPAGQ